MSRSVRIVIFILRLVLGWLFLYSGITKILDPSWSAEGIIGGAKTFSAFFHWLSLSQNIGWVNSVNAWGQALIGLSLMSGLLVKWSSVFGMLMMALYYLAVLNFPYPNAHSYLVDDHIIYFLIFLLLYFVNAGKFWGLDILFKKKNTND